MVQGKLLPNVTFNDPVRASLAALLADYDAEAIIAQLEDVAAIAPEMASPAVSKARTVLVARRRAVRECRRALVERHDLADSLMESELTWCRGQHGPLRERRAEIEANRAATLTWLATLEAALTAATTPLSARPPGRHVDHQAHWLIQETARVLGGAGAPVSHHEGGALARTLRILWPVILGCEAPIELRDVFKSVKLQRE